MTNFYPHSLIRLLVGTVVLLGMLLAQGLLTAHAQEQKSSLGARPITGSVQNQDLRRVPQAIVEVKGQEGRIVANTVTNDAGEFSVTVPVEGTYSGSAVHETYRSEYVVVGIGAEKPAAVRLTLAEPQE